MPQCPVCQAEGTIFGSEYKCPNNHVWHLCPEHCKEVVTSLVGEAHEIPDSCTCGMTCLSPKEMQANPVQVVKDEEPRIKLVPNVTHFNEKILAEVKKFNNNIRQELAKRNILIAAPIRRPKRIRKDNKIVKEVKLPSIENMPKSISDEGKKIWKRFFNKYHEYWEKYDDPNRQWSTCVAIWRNYAPKHGKSPFADSQIDDKSSTYMESRLVNGLAKAYKTTQLMTKYILSKGFGSKVLVLALKDIHKKDKTWQVTFGQEIKKCVPFTDKNFLKFLHAHSFRRSKSLYKREIATNVDLILREEENGSFMYIRFLIPEHTAQMALGLKSENMSNDNTIKKSLTKFFKTALKANR